MKKITLFFIIFILLITTLSCKSKNNKDFNDYDALFYNDITLLKVPEEAIAHRYHDCYRYYDKNGNQIGDDYLKAFNFYNGYAFVSYGAFDNFLINTKGERTTDESIYVQPIYKKLYKEIPTNYYSFSNNELLAFADYSGKELTDYIYSGIYYLFDDYFYAIKDYNKTIDILDNQGNVLFEFISYGFYYSHEFFCSVIKDTDKSLVTVYDWEFNKITTFNIPNYETTFLNFLNNELIFVSGYYSEGSRSYKDTYLVDFNGNKIEINTPDDYYVYSLVSVNPTVIQLKQLNTDIFICYNENLEPIIKDDYDNAYYRNEFIIAEKNGLRYLYDLNGNKVLNDGFKDIYINLKTKQEREEINGYNVGTLIENTILCVDNDNNSYYYDHNYNLLFKGKYNYKNIQCYIEGKYYYCEVIDNKAVLYEFNGKELKKIADVRPSLIADGKIFYYNEENHLIGKKINGSKILIDIEDAFQIGSFVHYYKDGYFMVLDNNYNYYIYNSNLKKLFEVNLKK